MNHHANHSRSLLLVMLVSIALSTGCATQGEKMVQGYSRTREAINESQKQVDTALVRLHALRSAPPDKLSDAYRGYKDAVVKLEEEGVSSKRRAEAMQAEADAHVKAWQKEMETLKDPAVKATMETRRQAVRSNFELIKMYAQDARKAYGPYLAGNQEIVRALAIDLSPASITSLSPSIDTVLRNGEALRQKLWMMEQALNNISAGVSPLGETK